MSGPPGEREAPPVLLPSSLPRVVTQPPRVQLLGVEGARSRLGERMRLAAEGTHTGITLHGNLAGVLVDPIWYAAAREVMGHPTDLA